jgi:hypothetical protein
MHTGTVRPRALSKPAEGEQSEEKLLYSLSFPLSGKWAFPESIFFTLFSLLLLARSKNVFWLSLSLLCTPLSMFSLFYLELL